MASRRKVIIFKKGGNPNDSVKLFKAIVSGKYKAPIEFTTKRGDFIVKTELAESTIQKLIPDWAIAHQTEKRVVFIKRWFLKKAFANSKGQIIN